MNRPLKVTFGGRLFIKFMQLGGECNGDIF